MNDDELLDLAHGLSARGEPYAMLTVVRAIAPTSAYVGAQAIVRATARCMGGSAGAAQERRRCRRPRRHRERRAEARAHEQ